MDVVTRESCKSQLEELVRVLSNTDGRETDRLILETCASLINAVSQDTSVDSMADAEIKAQVDDFKIIYYVLNSFMEKAAKAVPVSEEQSALMRSKSIYDEKCAEYNELVKQHGEIREKISTKEVEINSLYQTEGVLFRQFDELTQKLEYLQKLREKFDPDKLDALQEDVSKLKEITEELKERETSLNETVSEWLGELSKTLKNIGENTSNFTETVEKAKKDADEFRVAIDVCVKTCQNYKSWFNVAKTPWKQFEENAGTEEYRKLKGVSDEATLKEKNELFSRIEADLKKLESLVTACTLAAQSDYNKIIKDAGK